MLKKNVKITNSIERNVSPGNGSEKENKVTGIQK